MAPTVQNKGRIGAYFTAEEAGRVRAAYLNGWTADHTGSLSDFVKSAVLDAVEALEHAKNAGRQWPPVDVGTIKTVSQLNVVAKKQQASNND